MASANEKIEKRLTEILGAEAAIFVLCALEDVPYYPGSRETDYTSYRRYLRMLEAPKGSGCFEDGCTDIQVALRQGLSQEELWIQTWGEGDPEHPYTDKQYRRLDMLFKIMTGQLEAVGALTEQQEDTARTCAVWALQREEKSAKGDKESISIAKDLDKLIRDNLRDCNMRSMDISPAQAQRPDGFVDALKNKYGLSAEMTKDDVMQAFYTWCKSRKHPQTVDAEEHALLAIIQTMQKNNDLPVDVELPQELKLDQFGFEFADMANEEEQAAYDYLGIARGTA